MEYEDLGTILVPGLEFFTGVCFWTRKSTGSRLQTQKKYSGRLESWSFSRIMCKISQLTYKYTNALKMATVYEIKYKLQTIDIKLDYNVM